MDEIDLERLRLWLRDRRNKAQKERLALLAQALRLKQEIAEYDALLAELIEKAGR